MYIDPALGYSVFTAKYLQQRQCCGNYKSYLITVVAAAALAQAALAAGCSMYIDPVSGYSVFTAKYLEQRQCCGNKCRHCPHGWKNVQQLQQGKGAAATSKTEALDW
jgi:hypothetical protein